MPLLVGSQSLQQERNAVLGLVIEDLWHISFCLFLFLFFFLSSAEYEVDTLLPSKNRARPCSGLSRSPPALGGGLALLGGAAAGTGDTLRLLGHCLDMICICLQILLHSKHECISDRY